jgi:ABC-type sugar transport system substrate-binding protein
MVSHSHRWRASFFVSLAVAAALFVAACGGDDSSSGSASSGSSSTDQASTDSGLAAAKKIVDAASKAPATIGPSVPIGKPIPKDKTIVFINCGAPACTNMGASFKAAGTALGWKVEEIQSKPTPQEIQASFTEAIRRNPDGVVSTGFAKEQYARQLAELNAKKIPVFSGTGTDESSFDVSKDITLEPEPPSVQWDATRLLADKTIVDAGGKGEIGVVELTGYASVKGYTQAYRDEIKKNCSACTIKDITIEPTSIGKDAGAKIANFLRANPKVEHLFLSYDALAIGLPAAVKGVGRDMPTNYSWAPDQTGIEALQSGERTASVPLGYPEIAWQWADGFARIFTDGDIKDSAKWGGYVLWGKKYGNVPTDTENPPYISDYESQFKKLWGIS